MLKALPQRLQTRPAVFDTVLAVLLAATAVSGMWVDYRIGDVEFRDPDALGIALVLAGFLPLALRRQAPVAVAVLCGFPSIAFELLDYRSSLNGINVVVGVYTVAACRGPRAALLVLLSATAGTAVALSLTPLPVGPSEVLFNAVVLLTAWWLGRSVQLRRAYTAAVEARAEQLERDRAAAELAAVDAERRRIARELHDVVAHHVSVMVLQTTGARRVVDTDPARAAEALRSVEKTGRTALVEMRRLLHVLRPDEDAATGLEPQPGLDRLEELAGSFRAAGLQVDLDVQSPPAELAPGLGLSAYRIVQEALTNALKHAGRARASVRLRYDQDELDLQVHDDGNGVATQLTEPDGQRHIGHGLVGMRERAALHGGRVSAGPRRGGGFAVQARLPLRQTSDVDA